MLCQYFIICVNFWDWWCMRWVFKHFLTRVKFRHFIVANPCRQVRGLSDYCVVLSVCVCTKEFSLGCCTGVWYTRAKYIFTQSQHKTSSARWRYSGNGLALMLVCVFSTMRFGGLSARQWQHSCCNVCVLPLLWVCCIVFVYSVCVLVLCFCFWCVCSVDVPCGCCLCFNACCTCVSSESV